MTNHPEGPRPTDPEPKKPDKETEPQTAMSFWRMLGIPIPGGDSIESVIEAMIQAGAQPWEPPQPTSPKLEDEPDAPDEA